MRATSYMHSYAYMHAYMEMHACVHACMHTHASCTYTVQLEGMQHVGVPRAVGVLGGVQKVLTESKLLPVRVKGRAHGEATLVDIREEARPRRLLTEQRLRPTFGRRHAVGGLVVARAVAVDTITGVAPRRRHILGQDRVLVQACRPRGKRASSKRERLRPRERVLPTVVERDGERLAVDDEDEREARARAFACRQPRLRAGGRVRKLDASARAERGDGR